MKVVQAMSVDSTGRYCHPLRSDLGHNQGDGDNASRPIREDTIALVRQIIDTPAPVVAKIEAVLGY